MNSKNSLANSCLGQGWLPCLSCVLACTFNLFVLGVLLLGEEDESESDRQIAGRLSQDMAVMFNCKNK